MPDYYRVTFEVHTDTPDALPEPVQAALDEVADREEHDWAESTVTDTGIELTGRFPWGACAFDDVFELCAQHALSYTVYYPGDEEAPGLRVHYDHQTRTGSGTRIDETGDPVVSMRSLLAAFGDNDTITREQATATFQASAAEIAPLLPKSAKAQA